jgi:hypothetical protein
MELSKKLIAWLGAALWTVAGTSFAIAIDGPYNNPATDSALPAWVAVWVTIIGIPAWLSWGCWSEPPSHDNPGALTDTVGTIAFVGFNTAVLLVLMFMIALGCSGGWSTG